MTRDLYYAVIIGLIVVAAAGCSGPVGPFAGGALGGEEHSGVVTDWSFASDVETVQLETNPADPYSVNTWIGVVEGRAYIPTSLILGAENPEERAWVQNVMADANARVRVDGTVYPVRMQRVVDPAELDKARRMLMTKYAEEATDHSNAAWIYRLTAR